MGVPVSNECALVRPVHFLARVKIWGRCTSLGAEIWSFEKCALGGSK